MTATAVLESRGAPRIALITSLPFFGLHLACLGAFWTGVSWNAVLLAAASYWVRIFAITGGYHRYFAHRSYRTSRVFQFALAVIGCSALQKGPLWWAAHHRHHHQHSDQEDDVHSPDRKGFWWAHVGWILCDWYDATRFELVADFARYPELRWLNACYQLPGWALAIGCYRLLGGQGLVWGFFVSTVAVYHATFCINSLCHMIGRVRYPTTDTSRNSLILALLTLGEGWHNNHHYYATSTKMGFFWWEIDVTYYVLKALSFTGLVWDLKMPPTRVLATGRAN